MSVLANEVSNDRLERVQRRIEGARLAAHLAGQGNVLARQCQRQAGRSPKCSEAVIQFCLTIKRLFNLSLRQAMGMLQTLIKLAGLNWQVPDFSTVSRHQKHLGNDRGATENDRVALSGRQHRR
jgi:hypothetical protein